MCGIFGLLNSNGILGESERIFDSLSHLQFHRGPDGTGEFKTNKILMGMNRLSRIGIDNGIQPIWNASKNLAVVANGEIYNYVELRTDLIGLGYIFRTESDIEVIVHGFEEYGFAFFKRLRGMFSFALLNLKDDELILCRDRLGEKPLYVAETTHGIFFSSELRTLLQSGATSPILDQNTLHLYFRYGFVPEPFSIIKGVRQIQPGTLEIHSLENTPMKIQRYWDLHESVNIPNVSADICLAEILEEIAEIVIRSDVPIGVALSSGFDSSLVALLATKYGKAIHSFTVGYKGSPRMDESQAALNFSDAHGMTSHLTILTPKQVASGFAEMCLKRDEPIADLAGSGYLALAQSAHQSGIKVLLNGQGADELFWGYDWVRKATHFAILRERLVLNKLVMVEYFAKLRFPKGRGDFLDWILSGFGIYEVFWNLRQDLKSNSMGQVKQSIYLRRPRYRRIAKFKKKLLLTQERSEMLMYQSSRGEKVESQIFEEMLGTYLRTNGLAQMDRLAMSASIESRTPLVDFRLVELAFLNLTLKNSFKSPKKSFLIDVGNKITNRKIPFRKKMSFSPPVSKWSKEIQKYHSAEFSTPRLVEIGAVSNFATKVLKRPTTLLGRQSVLWLELAVLEIWIREIEKTSLEKFQVA